MEAEKKKGPVRLVINKKKLTYGLLALLVLAGFGTSAYLYGQIQILKNDPKTLQEAQKSKVNAIKDKVAKLISVPAEETPILATVDDKEKLKDQPFFKDAQNGDYILMFAQSKKAIIYRESENKLVNVGPIAITSDTNAQTQTPAGTTPVNNNTTNK